jgi:hypothetical protein
MLSGISVRMSSSSPGSCTMTVYAMRLLPRLPLQDWHCLHPYSHVVAG